MRLLVFVWVAVELLQIAVIAMLVVGYRNLERRVGAGYRFEDRPPRSVTEE